MNKKYKKKVKWIKLCFFIGNAHHGVKSLYVSFLRRE